MRILINILILVSILFLPWWVSAAVLLVSCFIIGRMYEAVIWGLAADALYGAGAGLYGYTHLFTAWAAFSLILSMTLRNRLSW